MNLISKPYRFIQKILPSFLISVLISGIYISQSYSDISTQPRTIPLECNRITGLIEQLCFIRTDSVYGPYDDIVFYLIDKAGNKFFLSSNSGNVSTFGGFDFSTHGKYMWLSWAEEGHPYFEFYLTKNFLEQGTSAKVLATLANYYFDQFEKFSDSGEVIYSVTEIKPHLKSLHLNK